MLDGFYHARCQPPDEELVLMTRIFGVCSAAGFLSLLAFGVTALVMSVPGFLHGYLMS